MTRAVVINQHAVLQVFKRNGLERYRPLRDKFDPNMHSALFEVPDPGQKPGTVAVVTKASSSLDFCLTAQSSCHGCLTSCGGP